MENNTELLQSLEGIRAELQQLNKTLATMATQQALAAQAPSQSRPAQDRAIESRPSQSRRPAPRSTARTGRTGGYKRTSEESESNGFGAEMAARFPKKRSAARPKGKAPAKAKKGSGYPKKAR